MASALRSAGIEVEQIHAEAGHGQFEIATGHCGPLEVNLYWPLIYDVCLNLPQMQQWQEALRKQSRWAHLVSCVSAVNSHLVANSLCYHGHLSPACKACYRNNHACVRIFIVACLAALRCATVHLFNTHLPCMTN